MDYRICYSVDAIDTEAWDRLADDCLVMHTSWLRLIEKVWRDQQRCYIMLYDAAGCAAIITGSLNATFSRVGVREKILKRSSVVLSAPYSSNNPGILLRSDVSFERILPYFQRAMAELCWRKQRLVYAISNVPDSDIEPLRRYGFSMSEQPVFSILHLRPGITYDEYLAELPSKDRAEIRRIRRRAVENEITFDHGPLRPGESEELYPLLLQVYARHGHTEETMPFGPDMLAGWDREQPGHLFIFRGYVKGKLEGILCCTRQGDTVWWPMAGLNYAVSRQTYLYFVLMDEMIRWYIDQHVTTIYGGLTNEKEKSGHGFQQETRWFCYRAHPAPLNSLFQMLQPTLRRVIGGPDDTPPRDPVMLMEKAERARS